MSGSSADQPWNAQATAHPRSPRYCASSLRWRVLDVPWPVRWAVLHLAILPRRPRTSAHAIRRSGRPKARRCGCTGRELVRKVQQRLGASAKVELAMRYGVPSIAEAMRSLEQQGGRRIVVFPLYPQHSSAATGSSLEAVFAAASRLWNVPRLQIVPPFYEIPDIACFAEVAEPAHARDRRPSAFSSASTVCRATDPQERPDRIVLPRAPGCCESARRRAPGGSGGMLSRAVCDDRAPDRGQARNPERAAHRVFPVTPWSHTVDSPVHRSRGAGRGSARRQARRDPRSVVRRRLPGDAREIGLRAVDDWEDTEARRCASSHRSNAADSWADAGIGIARDASSWCLVRRRAREGRVGSLRRRRRRNHRLAAAHGSASSPRRAAKRPSVLLLESSGRAGGLVHTERIDGMLLEGGPTRS
jgi:hypothetical protein